MTKTYYLATRPDGSFFGRAGRRLAKEGSLSKNIRAALGPQSEPFDGLLDFSPVAVPVGEEPATAGYDAAWPMRLFEVAAQGAVEDSHGEASFDGIVWLRRLTVVAEIDAQVAFGPGQVQVSRLLAKASRTNSTQRLELAAAFSLAQGEGFDAAREVLISTARAAGRLSAMSLAMDAAFAVAGLAASYMAAVLVVADALPRTEAAVLATPWRQVMLAPRREADPQPPGPRLESGPREAKATSALGVI